MSHSNITQIDVNINSTAVVRQQGWQDYLLATCVCISWVTHAVSSDWAHKTFVAMHVWLTVFVDKSCPVWLWLQLWYTNCYNRECFLCDQCQWCHPILSTVRKYMLSLRPWPCPWPCLWWQQVQCCCICYLRLNQSTTTVESSAFELIIPVGCNYLAGLSCSKLSTFMLRDSARCATGGAQTIWTYRLQYK